MSGIYFRTFTLKVLKNTKPEKNEGLAYIFVKMLAGPHVQLVGCWAHARRKFDEALKALPTTNPTASVVAKEGLNFCNQLFVIEREIKDLSYEERHHIRLERSQPVLDAFSAWLSTQQKRVLPKSAFGQAIAYCRNQWNKLEAFMLDGRLELDNNRSLYSSLNYSEHYQKAA